MDIGFLSISKPSGMVFGMCSIREFPINPYYEPQLQNDIQYMHIGMYICTYVHIYYNNLILVILCIKLV